MLIKSKRLIRNILVYFTLFSLIVFISFLLGLIPLFNFMPLRSLIAVLISCKIVWILGLWGE